MEHCPLPRFACRKGPGNSAHLNLAGGNAEMLYHGLRLWRCLCHQRRPPTCLTCCTAAVCRTCAVHACVSMVQGTCTLCCTCRCMSAVSSAGFRRQQAEWVQSSSRLEDFEEGAQSQEGLLGKVNCPAQSSGLVDRLFILLNGLGVCHQPCACLHISSRSLADMAWNSSLS